MITDEMLYESAKKAHEALAKAIDDLPDYEYPISKSLERRVKRIIWRAKHKIAYSVLRAAACILLVITLSGATVLTFNVEARAAFINWIQRQYEAFIEHRFCETADNTDIASYKLGWVPDGYTEDTTHIIPNGKTTAYTNSLGDIIKLEYCQGLSNTCMYTFANDSLYTHYPVTVNDIHMDIYISNEADINNSIIWSDNNNNILFMISGFMDKADLIKMAENIIVLE